MQPTGNIKEELLAIGGSLLANAGSNGRPFAVPEGYFDRFPAAVLDRLQADSATIPGSAAAETGQLSPLLAGLSKKMPYQVPEGYFQPEAAASPLLHRLEKKMPYQVPAGYFENFADQLLKKVTGRATVPAGARVVSFKRNVFRYAVAAAMTAVVATGGWLYTSKKTTGNGNQDVAAELKQALDQVSDDAIFEYSDVPGISQNTLAANDLDLNAADIHFLLEDVSDNALQDFLNLEKPAKKEILHN
ncbi:MAG: hypothetical protein QM664_06425 [Flavihumibacter sp.]